ncbi:MAG: phosphodiester glycosidase family protein [Rhizobiaceae bacterium]
MAGTNSMIQLFGGALLLALVSGPSAAEARCNEREFEGNGYAICSFDPAHTTLELHWLNSDGAPHRTFSALAGALAEEGAQLSFAMNGGMFQTDFTPVGLHVERGTELRPLNRFDAPSGIRPVPNFYKKPNGVFFVTRDGAGVLSSEVFRERSPAVLHATQSGPMLVIDGELHPALIEGSRDRTWRTGVGISSDGHVHFAISLGHVNFHDFARLFRDGLSSDNALFLDGGRGTGLFAPELGRNDFSWHGGFGPIIGAVER